MASPKRGIGPAVDRHLSWSLRRLPGASACLIRVRFGDEFMVEKIFAGE